MTKGMYRISNRHNRDITTILLFCSYQTHIGISLGLFTVVDINQIKRENLRTYFVSNQVVLSVITTTLVIKQSEKKSLLTYNNLIYNIYFHLEKNTTFHFLITACKHNIVSNQHAIVFLLQIEKNDPEKENYISQL